MNYLSAVQCSGVRVKEGPGKREEQERNERFIQIFCAY